MDARMMEVLVFVDGVDAMTSKVMQARRNYMPSEMMLNEQVGGWMRGGGSIATVQAAGSAAAGAADAADEEQQGSALLWGLVKVHCTRTCVSL